jgi:Domain of unknown function (DUF4126)
MELALALGIGIGLASVAGVRAFAPLALAALFAALMLFEPPSPYVDVGGDGWWTSFGALAGLAVLEIVLDKIRGFERVFNYVMVPVRAASGGLLFTAALGFDLDAGSTPWLVAGALVAGGVAVLKVVLRPAASTESAGVSTVSISVFEDLVGILGGVLALFVPYLPVLLVAFLLFFYHRVRKRRGRKFGGLRILGD